jgi:hypothetical protein
MTSKWGCCIRKEHRGSEMFPLTGWETKQKPSSLDNLVSLRLTSVLWWTRVATRVYKLSAARHICHWQVKKVQWVKNYLTRCPVLSRNGFTSWPNSFRHS